MAYGVGSQWGKITLFDAAADGNLEKCKERLSSSWSKVNAQDVQGRTAIHEASRWGHLEVVKFLVSKDGNPKIVDQNGSLALHLAATGGHDDVVSYFINELKIDINSIDKSKNTPLHLAAGAGKVSTVQLLLKLGSNTSLVNASNRVPKDCSMNVETNDVFNEWEGKRVKATDY